MRSNATSSRRDFCRITAAAILTRPLTGFAAPQAATGARPKVLTADESLRDLVAGNERFVKGQTINPRRGPSDFSALEKGQYPQAVVIIAGVNDVYQGRAVDHVTAQLDAMYARARAAGIPVIAGTIVPYNTATADQNARMHAINTWIRRFAHENPGDVWCADTRLAAAEPGDIDRLSGSPDGLHPDIDGYRRMADALAPVIGAALPTIR